MLTTTDNSRQIDRLGGAIKAYQKASGRTLAFAMIKIGRELAFRLFQETAKTAPTIAALKALPERLGFRIRRPHAARQYSADQLVLFKKMGRRKFPRTSTVPKEIERRIRARKFSAAGWKPAIKAFVRPDTVTSIDKVLGAVIAAVDMNGRCHIVEINRAGAIAKVTDRHEILRKAVDAVMQDKATYIGIKLGEEAKKAFLEI